MLKLSWSWVLVANVSSEGKFVILLSLEGLGMLRLKATFILFVVLAKGPVFFQGLHLLNVLSL